MLVSNINSFLSPTPSPFRVRLFESISAKWQTRLKLLMSRNGKNVLISDWVIKSLIVCDSEKTGVVPSYVI